MKANVLFQRVPMYCYSVCLRTPTLRMAFFPGSGAVTAGEWTILSPRPSACYFTTVPKVGTSGDAAEPSKGFTIAIKIQTSDYTGTVVSSASGTSTASSSNPQWNADIPAPANGFYAGDFDLVMEPNGDSSLGQDIKFTAP